MVKIFNATLILTNKCNLRCVYCYEKQAGNKFSGNDMSEEIIINSLKFLLNHTNLNRSTDSKFREFNNQDLLSIYLWGGEPTLRPDLIKFAMEHGNSMANGLGKKIKWRISTNGALVDYKIAGLINDFEIYLSVDDYNIVQEKTRGCSAEYLKGDVWKYLIDRSYVVVRIVNHPGYARGRLPEQVESLMDLGFKRFFPSTASGYGWKEEDFRILERDYRILTDWHMKGIISLPNCNEYMEEDDGSLETEIWTGDKIATCITVNGDIFPSDLDSYLGVSKIGNVLGVIDESVLESIAKERSYKVDDSNVCGSCIAKKYCPGYGPVVYHNNKGESIPYYYQDCCREYLAKIRCWYRIKNSKEPVNAYYSRLVDVNR